MSSNSTIKRHIDPDIFKQYLKSKNISIRQLGSLISSSERTIRRCIDQRSITLNVALDICAYFNCSFETIFGIDDSAYWKRMVERLHRTIN